MQHRKAEITPIFVWGSLLGTSSPGKLIRPTTDMAAAQKRQGAWRSAEQGNNKTASHAFSELEHTLTLEMQQAISQALTAQGVSVLRAPYTAAAQVLQTLTLRAHGPAVVTHS